MTTKQLVLLLSTLVTATQSFSMAGDNRYFPWYSQPYTRTVEKRSNFQTELFFMTGDEAFGNSSKEKKGIPEIWGTYDQKLLSEVLISIGLTSPLLAQWQLQKVIEWTVDQKIEAQGMALRGEWALTKKISVGAAGGLMHVNCNQTFKIPRSTRAPMGLTPSQEEELDRERRAMNDLIGLTGTQWKKTGLLDTEVYVRWGGVWDYILKSRQVDAAVVGGFYIPTGEERDINNSASIPFGGNKASGLFINSDFSFELKEDWTFGMALRLSNRFKKIQKHRLPVKKENHLFGAITGDVEVDEGVTLVWNPYFRFGDLQDGLGVHLGYTLATHSGDVWTDKRSDKTISIDLNNIYGNSKWNAEYVSLHVFYDSGKVTKTDKIRPIITFDWDIPVKALAAKEVSKTHKIALGIAFIF